MARALAGAGLDVHIATTDDHDVDRRAVPLGSPIAEDGVTVWYFPRQTRFYTASWPLTTWLARHIADYDLVHVHCLFTYATLPTAFWATRHRVPYVIRPMGTLMWWGRTQRRPALKRVSFALIERRILAHAALVHFTSEQEREEAAGLGIRTPSAVIPLGIDLSAFDHLPPPGYLRTRYPHLAGRPVALFLSRLHPVKGLDLLLPAFAQARTAQPNVALVIAGSGTPEYVTGLRRQVRALGLEGDVVFTGFLEGPDKIAALADCDLFVLPSHSENFGIAALEAMAARAPVIVTEHVPIHREITRAGAGLVVPAQVDALAAALRSLAERPMERVRMGDRGRTLVEHEFSLSTMTARLAQAYARYVG